MASLVRCPHCGPRPREEFAIRGAALSRPEPDADRETWCAYVYLRENPRGPYAEHWHHTGGCRRWLVVTRNTLTHEQIDVRDVAEPGARA
jgi:sarcosine oxidase subunit delta